MDALNLNFMQFANQVPYLNEQFVLGCFDFMRRKTSSVAASVAPKSTQNPGCDAGTATLDGGAGFQNRDYLEQNGPANVRKSDGILISSFLPRASPKLFLLSIV